MKDTTRDFVAMELLILATLAVASLITPFLLSALGLWLPPTYIGGVLYLFRWTWWAVQHCRSRPHLHAAVARLLRVAGALVSLGGVMLLLFALRQQSRGAILGGVAALALLGAGVRLIWWSYKEFSKPEPREHPGSAPSSAS